MSGRKKAKPVKFGDGEWELVSLLAEKKSVSAAAIVRRSVKLLLEEINRRGPTWDWLEATSDDLDPVFIAKMTAHLESRAITERILDESAAQRRETRGSSKPRRAS